MQQKRNGKVKLQFTKIISKQITPSIISYLNSSQLNLVRNKYKQQQQDQRSNKQCELEIKPKLTNCEINLNDISLNIQNNTYQINDFRKDMLVGQLEEQKNQNKYLLQKISQLEDCITNLVKINDSQREKIDKQKLQIAKLSQVNVNTLNQQPSGALFEDNSYLSESTIETKNQQPNLIQQMIIKQKSHIEKQFYQKVHNCDQINQRLIKKMQQQERQLKVFENIMQIQNKQPEIFQNQKAMNNYILKLLEEKEYLSQAFEKIAKQEPKSNGLLKKFMNFI